MREVVEFHPVDVQRHAVEHHLLIGHPILHLHQSLAVAHTFHFFRHLLVGDKVHTLLDGAYSILVEQDFRLIVEIFVANAMREIVARQFLDAVFNHVTNHQHDKKRQSEIAEFLLEKETHHRGKHHRQPGGNAQIQLLHQFAIFLLRHIQVEVAVNIFLQHTATVNQVAVVFRIVFLQVHISHLIPVGILTANLGLEPLDRGSKQFTMLRIFLHKIENEGGVEFKHIADKLIAVAEIVAYAVGNGGLVHDSAQRSEGTQHLVERLQILCAQCGHHFGQDVRTHQIVASVASRAVGDGREHLHLILILLGGGASGRRCQILKRRLQIGERNATAAHYVLKQEFGRDYTHIRLDVLIEA